VELVSGVTAEAWRGGLLVLSDDSTVQAGAVVWATSTQGPALLRDSGLACDAQGCVLVDRRLRSLSHPSVFATGDCATVENAARSKSGAWVGRPGAVLADNVARAAQGRRPRRWYLQRAAPTVVGLGDGRALAWYSRIAVSGRWVCRWKDGIDRRWLSGLTVLPEVRPADS
jgi:selenide, water dikinase